MTSVKKVTVHIDERQLLELVVCAFVASEIESAFDLEHIEQMPSPFPDLLARVRDIYDRCHEGGDLWEQYPRWQDALDAMLAS